MLFSKPAVNTAGFLFYHPSVYRVVREERTTMNSEPSHSHPPRALVLAAFATVYLVWGSTYLAIRIAIDTLPPFLMAGSRFLLAGGVLFLWLRLRGAAWPERIHWRNAAVSGVLLLVAGNGLVVWAEQTVPSGLTALLIGLAPAWFAIFEWLRPGGTAPQPRTVAGILVGFGGMALLVLGHGTPTLDRATTWHGALMLSVATISWVSGSFFSKHQPHAASPWMNAAIQMIWGGIVLVLIASFTGEWTRVQWGRVSVQSWLALLYLIVFGSLIAFSAYVWLLKVSKPSHIATYAYVNPVIALFLGRIVLGETLSSRTLVAAAIILTGVVIITLPGNAIRNRKSKAEGTRRGA
jgi:drug/metabolite transporter (DMT)-like permease